DRGLGSSLTRAAPWTGGWDGTHRMHLFGMTELRRERTRRRRCSMLGRPGRWEFSAECATGADGTQGTKPRLMLRISEKRSLNSRLRIESHSGPGRRRRAFAGLEQDRLRVGAGRAGHDPGRAVI